jgi:hypothetical protein
MRTGEVMSPSRDTDTHADAGNGQSPHSVAKIVGSLVGWIEK